ncbi:UNVERIFIED_CONTAM: hypothetical protein HHA_316390 [Hammondia hammondi]|eukprot:XP_008883325.1 hypothetical protein HHA_316390 [Hammondia hammondi]
MVLTNPLPSAASPCIVTADRCNSNLNLNGYRYRVGEPASDAGETVVRTCQSDWTKLEELFTSKYTQDLADRHATTFSKLCRQYMLNYGGFLWADLTRVTPLVDRLVTKFREGRLEYAPALRDLCSVASKPFVSQRASEPLVHADAAIHFVLTLSRAAASTSTVSSLPPSTKRPENEPRVLRCKREQDMRLEHEDPAHSPLPDSVSDDNRTEPVIEDAVNPKLDSLQQHESPCLSDYSRPSPVLLVDSGSSGDASRDDAETYPMPQPSYDSVADSVSVSVFQFIKAFAELWQPSPDENSPRRQILL